VSLAGVDQRHGGLTPAFVFFLPVRSQVENSQMASAGSMMAFCLSFGLFLGTLAGFGLRGAACHCNPFISSGDASNATGIAAMPVGWNSGF
jgi:hypothetical protein